MNYHEAVHAMQTGVALDMVQNPKTVEPKHLRVGINSALCDSAALARLLIRKGIITAEEYATAVTEEMLAEVQRYEAKLGVHLK